MTREQKLIRLQELMSRHGLTYKSVAALLYVSPATCTSWTRPPTNNASRELPLGYLELLEYKLGERK